MKVKFDVVKGFKRRIKTTFTIKTNNLEQSTKQLPRELYKLALNYIQIKCMTPIQFFQ